VGRLSSPTGLEGIDSWPGEHPAAGWLTADGRTATAGDADHVHRLASVTKVLSAMAVLVAVEDQTVGLDEPAGPPGSTVRLLLCHASGLPFSGATPIAAPGQRRIYGNTAYAVLGQLVAERSGIAFADYVREAVCEPLGMTRTTIGSHPAHGARAPLGDLLLLAGELLHPGRALSPATLAEATTAQLPDLKGVLPGFGRQDPNPWGLGVEIRDHKSPHWMPPDASPDTFGHFGQSGSFLWVDPHAGVACAGLSDEPFGDWAREAWPALGSAVLRAASG
jgi:CubicO group peptidase (beta-lactamase class C family)